MMENAMHVDTERSIIVNMAIVTKGRITSKSAVYRISTIHLLKRRKRRSMGVKILSSSEIS